jgi:EAL domain-containing protein (putative c-di-GMP-specific phosphodiesterase class I)
MVSRTLESLAVSQGVQIFNLSNLDVVLMCRNAPIDEVDDAVFRVRALFNEDSITQAEDGSAEDRFSAWYDLSQSPDLKDFEDSVVAIDKLVASANSKLLEPMTTGRASKVMRGEALTPDMLQGIMQKLLEARIGDLVHRQPTVRVSANKKQELAFREHYISMEELRARIAPKVNIFSSHWLFQYLSEVIDARVLEVLSRLDYASMDYPVSINLNVSTIMSRPFQNFNAIVGENTEKVVIEIQMIDIFADMRGYEQTRDWLQERGYRVLIDGLNPLTLDFFNPITLRADFIKINWGPEVQGGLGQGQTEQIKSVIKQMKPGTVVLSRVDSEEGVSWGLGLGIMCFQGHFIDKVVEAMAAKGALK